MADRSSWNTDPARCPGVTCEGPCPRSGCICKPCNCPSCARRRRHAARNKTPLRARAEVPVRERLFDPEADPIGARR